MGISVDLEDSTLIRSAIDRARRQTTAELIIRSLRTKFDQVPGYLPVQLEKLSIEELRGAFDRSTTATSLDDVLAIVAACSDGGSRVR
ncbi:hypothetical protein [Bradyrhizobium mercantei]|uniref:hypothetical protein n=1 Tax=Bradyrhizobium mercantei TaxID=1904807 RepID=UPI0009756D82|nr:hypothetical protein [Bradyrhizobium mercantei]